MKATRAFGRMGVLLVLGAAALTAAPKAKVTPAAPAEAKQEEAPGKIEGIEIARPGGGFLGLQIVNNNFVLSFYDANKRKATADAARATLRWAVKYQPNDERLVLNATADGFSLTSTKTVKPPHVLKVYLNLFTGDGEGALETHVVDYHD